MDECTLGILGHALPACRRIASALAIGCIYRSKGGIALLGTVNHAAQTLLAVARASSGSSHVWLLHSLWLVANAAGLSFMPNVTVSCSSEARKAAPCGTGLWKLQPYQ